MITKIYNVYLIENKFRHGDEKEIISIPIREEVDGKTYITSVTIFPTPIDVVRIVMTGESEYVMLRILRGQLSDGYFENKYVGLICELQPRDGMRPPFEMVIGDGDIYENVINYAECGDDITFDDVVNGNE